ncbi:uncharacterized protein LOC143894180 [Temnothorax americanus]|uniref:uncharacterized protein LOC143894180 n=1 Tax=Temnothorax americanus TaxID=1964332 RepID=UPI004068699D
MRVTEDHWATLVEYAEENNEIVTNQLLGPRRREMLCQKWDILTILLNSIGNGSKTVTEWKKQLKHSIIRQSQTGTGGGPSCGLLLSDIELRFLQLMGQTALNGDEGVQEYDLPKQNNPMQKTRKNMNASSETVTLTQQKSNTENVQKRKYEDIDNYSIDEINENITKENTTNVRSPNVTSSRKKKIELSCQIERMNNNTLDVLKSIDSNIGRLAIDLKKKFSFYSDFVGGKE